MWLLPCILGWVFVNQRKPRSHDPLFICIDSCVNKELMNLKETFVLPKAITILPPFQFISDEELFSGMYIDFMGTDAAIFRSLTRRNAVRTDQHNSKWLSGEMPSIYQSFSGCHSGCSAFLCLKQRPYPLKSLSLNLTYEVEPWKNVCKYKL